MEMLHVKRGKILEEQEKAKGFEGSQDQILCESCYTDTQDRLFWMNTTCPYVTQHPLKLGTWFKNQGKALNHILGLNKGQRELFSDFLQRLIKAVQIRVTDPEAKWVLIESLTFENANL